MAHLAHVIWRASRHKGLWPWLACMAVAALVIGCGGGGTSTAGNGVGVGGTGAAAGPVSGYGSVIVNDVRFDFSRATFTTEDAADGDDDESLGQSLAAAARPVEFGTMLSITSGDISNDGSYNLAQASRIVLISAIRGPIEAKSVINNTLTVLGQQVDVDAGTWYEANHALAQLSPGDKVVVYGDYNPVTGHYKATRVEYRSILPIHKVRGAVSALSGNTFMLGTLKVNFAGARGNNQNLQNGKLVRVRILASTPLVSGAYAAQVVSLIAPGLSNGAQTRLAGVATGVTGGALEINGTPVDFSHATVTGGAPSDDGRLEVEGTIQNGVLVATKVTVKPQTDVELSKVRLIGPVDAPVNNGTSGNFKLKGDVTVNWDTSTQFDNGVTSSTLTLGLQVDVEGNRSTTSQTAITATRVRLASH